MTRLIRPFLGSLVLSTALFNSALNGGGLKGVGLAPAIAQEAPPALTESAPSNTTSSSPPSAATQTPDDGIYFADILVRGRPVFQVGSLSGINARQRAEIINRRIASLLSRTSQDQSIQVEVSNAAAVATLRANQRILMTITQQDAEDFGLSVADLADQWATQLNQAFDRPPLALDVAQRLSATTRSFGRSVIDGLPALVGAIVVIGVTWAIANLVRYLAFTWAQKTEGDHSTEILLGRLAYGAVWILGSVIALGILGVEFGALLGALGLTSVAIGFSLKDVLSNYISGVILLAARPFRLGDEVVIEGYEGRITQIQLRATTLRTYDGRVVYIPNQEVFGAIVTNNTASNSRRSSVIVGVDYEADLQEAQRVIKAAIAQVSTIQPNPKPDILIKELAASTVNLEVRFWVDSRRSGFLETTSLVTRTIKEALEQAEIEMPTEIYTLLFRNAPPGMIDGEATHTIAVKSDVGTTDV